MMNKKLMSNNPLILYSVPLIFGFMCITPLHAQSADDEMAIQQLRALKTMCDEDLVNPTVCIEKQRQILKLEGNPSNTSAANSRTTPDPTRLSNLPQSRSNSVYKISDLSFALPSDWVNVTPIQMKEGFQFIEKQLEGDDESQNTFKQLETMAATSSTRIYSKSGSTLLIRPQKSTLQTSSEEVQIVCDRISDIISSTGNREMHECALRDISGIRGLYIEQDALAQGARTLIFMAAVGPAKTVQFVLDSTNSDIGVNKQELDEIVASVTWN